VAEVLDILVLTEELVFHDAELGFLVEGEAVGSAGIDGFDAI
jgi:hypothetical protein